MNSTEKEHTQGLVETNNFSVWSLLIFVILPVCFIVVGRAVATTAQPQSQIANNGKAIDYTDKEDLYEADVSYYTKQGVPESGDAEAMEGLYVVLPHSQNWEFSVSHFSSRVGATDAQSVGVKMKGKHITAPCGAAANDLGSIGTPSSKMTFNGKKYSVSHLKKGAGTKRGESKMLAAWGKKQHGDHWDKWSIMGNTSYMVEKINNQTDGTLNTHAIIKANHVKQEPEIESTFREDLYTEKETIGWNSSLSPAATLSFDSSTSTLSFDVGEINVLDWSGGQTEVIVGAYENDAIVSAITDVNDIVINFPPNDNGVYSCSEGNIIVSDIGLMTLADPNGSVFLMASFDELLIGDAGSQSRGVAHLTSGSACYNIFGSSHPQSQFLHDFVERNAQVTSSSENRSMILSFETMPEDPNLFIATNGYTLSASDIPINLYISESLPIERLECDFDWNDTVDLMDFVYFAGNWLEVNEGD